MTSVLRGVSAALAAVLLGGPLASAQNASAGAKAGVSGSALSGSQEFSWRLTQPTAALMLNRVLRPRFSLQGELGAFRRLGVSNQVGSTLTLTADYVELPVILQWHPRSFGPLRPFLGVGPTMNYRLRCSLVFVGGGVSSDNDCDAGFGARSNRLDVGAAGGLGIDVQIGRAVLQLESRAVGGARTNVLPIDVQSRAVSWSTTAGVLAPLSRGPLKSPDAPGERAPTAGRGVQVPRRIGKLKDEQIAAILLAYATAAVSYARLVPRRSTRADVRTYAQQMAVEHVDMVRQVNAVVTALDIDIEDSGTSLHMRDESTEEREPLYFTAGVPFDTAFAATALRFQTNFLAALDAILAQPAHSPEMRALVIRIRSVAENDLAETRHLLQDLEAKPVIAAVRTARPASGSP